ncbi:MAG: phosphotransferase [Sandaracinaceae bacterium]
MDELTSWVAELTGAREARVGERVASLWSGYGSIVRVRLDGGPAPSVVVKRVEPPPAPTDGPSARSHARKLRSYEVERAFYERFAGRCTDESRVAHCYGARASGSRLLIAFEDLDASGFPSRRHGLGEREVGACLGWLAAFHGTFLGVVPDGLWEEGTYWHLATRPDELARMRDGPLEAAASALDARLRGARHRTLVHGDAKPANFCFGSEGVAAVDFQYVGGGVGVRDVAYLLSCASPAACAAHAERWLDVYFERLAAHAPDGVDAREVEDEWRALLPTAWADFERFLAGWAPSEHARDPFSRAMIERALRAIAEPQD